MKIFKKALVLLMALCASGICELSAQTTGVYAGGYIRRERPGTITTLRNSGFHYVVLFNIKVEPDGTLVTDGETVCKDGRYVYGSTNPDYVSDIKKLKEAPTSISRIEICVGGWGDESYFNIRSLIQAHGTGSNSILYRNFKALKDAIPVIDAINNDDEWCYDVNYAEQFHRMMYSMGYKTTLAPYMNRDFWSQLANRLGSGICDRIMVQCYDGGAGNNPRDWHLLDGVPVHGGRFHYQDETLDATRHADVMQGWKNEGADGGFFWVFNDNTWNTNQYASRLNRIFGVKHSSDTRATIYVDSDYNGYSVSLGEGTYPQSELALYGFIAGDLSSLKVTPGFRITLYENPDLTGASRSYTSDANNVGDFNDKARSLKIEAWGKSGLEGNHKIRNRNSGKYLDTDNNLTENNTAIIQSDNEGDDPSQTWTFIELGNGVYKICAFSNPQRAFDVKDGSCDNSTQVQLYDYVDARNQQFILYDKGDGYYQIIDRNSGKAVEMPQSTTDNGAWIKTWDNNGTNAQQWALDDNKCPGAGVITLYADADYNGRAATLSEGDYSLSRLKLYNLTDNQISSLKVNPGFKIILYENDYCGGSTSEHTADVNNLGGFNDKTTSVRIMAWGNPGMEGNHKICNRESNLYLDTADNRTDNDTPVMQFYDEGDDPSQTWTFTHLGNGVYGIGTFAAPDQGLDVANAGSDNGTQVKIYKYSGGKNQQFIVYDKGDGYYQIIDRNSGKPIEIPGSSHTAGDWIKIYDNNGTNAQQWSIADNRTAGEAIVTIYRDINFAGKAVQLAEGEYNAARLSRYNFNDNDLTSLKVTPGFKVTLYDGDNFSGLSKVVTSDTSWIGDDWNDRMSSMRIETNGSTGLGGEFYLQNRNSGHYLDLDNRSTENGTHVIQYSFESHPHQLWKLKEVENGVYAIAMSTDNNKVFDVKDAATDNGSEIQINTYSGAPHQQFIIYTKNSGNQVAQLVNSKSHTYQLISRHSGRVVEVPGSSLVPGEWVRLYDNNGSDTQQWNLIDSSSIVGGFDNVSVSGIEIMLDDRQLVIAGCSGKTAAIFDPSGRLFLTTYVSTDNETVSLANLKAGIYIVAVGDCRQKISLR